ncbi:hypothetical protein [Halodesulfovibrio aestuarii]|uniref:hypothetical protein n=1 Tax=Halodesulfovibrio aestuarii TaxID=126333 RepID=UPI0004816B66
MKTIRFNIDGQDYIWGLTGRKCLATPSQVTHDKKNDPVKMVVPNFWIIIKEDGTLLFILKKKPEDEDNSSNFILTTHEAIAMKLQWVTPKADGFRKVLWVNQSERADVPEETTSQLDNLAEGINRARNTPAGRIVERSVKKAGTSVAKDFAKGFIFGGPVPATLNAGKSFLLGIITNSLREIPEVRKWEHKILLEVENVQTFLEDWEGDFED